MDASNAALAAPLKAPEKTANRNLVRSVCHRSRKIALIYADRPSDRRYTRANSASQACDAARASICFRRLSGRMSVRPP